VETGFPRGTCALKDGLNPLFNGRLLTAPFTSANGCEPIETTGQNLKSGHGFLRMIRKSGYRFSEKIMRQPKGSSDAFA
jgi:hypothetical protein